MRKKDFESFLKSGRRVLCFVLLMAFFACGGLAGSWAETGSDADTEKSTADELKEMVIAYNQDSNTATAYTSEYKEVLTAEDSPIKVTEVSYFGHIAYFIEANAEFDPLAGMKYMNGGLSDELTGSYVYFKFKAPVEDCVAVLGLEVSVNAMNKEKSAAMDWVSALHVVKDVPEWALVDYFDYVDGVPAEAEYVGDILYGEGHTFDAFMVVSTDGQRMYNEDGFYISYGSTELAFVVNSEEAARNYMVNVGLEDYLW